METESITIARDVINVLSDTLTCLPEEVYNTSCLTEFGTDTEVHSLKPALENTFNGMQLPEEDFEQFETVADVVDYVVNYYKRHRSYSV